MANSRKEKLGSCDVGDLGPHGKRAEDWAEISHVSRRIGHSRILTYCCLKYAFQSRSNAFHASFRCDTGTRNNKRNYDNVAFAEGFVKLNHVVGLLLDGGLVHVFQSVAQRAHGCRHDLWYRMWIHCQNARTRMSG